MIINPYVFATAAPVTMKWDSAHYQSDRLTLSNSDLTATRTTGGGATPGLARATISKDAGLWYTEVLAVNVAGGLIAIGLVFAPMDVSPAGTLFLGESTGGFGYWADGSKWFNNSVTTSWGATWAATDVIGLAFNRTTGNVWFAKNNAWQASGDPAAGTSPAFTSFTAEVWPTVDCYGAGASATIRTPAQFSYSPPAGFTGWE